MASKPKHSCWDGKNLDTPNHKDHVAHPASGPTSFAVVGGKCPETHPVKIPQVMLEASRTFTCPSTLCPMPSRLQHSPLACTHRVGGSDWVLTHQGI